MVRPPLDEGGIDAPVGRTINPSEIRSRAETAVAACDQAAADGRIALCASVFCQAGSARRVAYQRLISAYGSTGIRAISARFIDAPSEKSAMVSLSPVT